MIRLIPSNAFLKSIILVMLWLLVQSCLGPKARMLKRARKSGITKEQYDSLLSTLYTLKTKDYSSKSDLIYFDGYYVSKYFTHDTIKHYYSIIKFDTLGNIYHSQRINFPPSNKMLGKIYFGKERYAISGDTLFSETLAMSSGDMELHNRIHYAQINRDTLSFYKIIDLQRSSYSLLINPVKKYVYIDSLTESITYPPTFLPLDNQ